MFSVDPESARGAAEHDMKLDRGGANRLLGGASQPDAIRLFSELGEPLSLAVTATLDSLARDWRALKQTAPVSPYQRVDLAESWLLHAAGFEPRIGVLRNAKGEAVMILPFGLVSRLSTTVGVYLGGD